MEMVFDKRNETQRNVMEWNEPLEIDSTWISSSAHTVYKSIMIIHRHFFDNQIQRMNF